MDLFKYTMFGDIGSGVEFFESSDQELVARVAEEHRCGMAVTIVIRKIITLFWTPMELAGFLLDFLLHLVFQNGNSFGLLYNLLQGKYYLMFIICTLLLT